MAKKKTMYSEIQFHLNFYEIKQNKCLATLESCALLTSTKI